MINYFFYLFIICCVCVWYLYTCVLYFVLRTTCIHEGTYVRTDVHTRVPGTLLLYKSLCYHLSCGTKAPQESHRQLLSAHETWVAFRGGLGIQL